MRFFFSITGLLALLTITACNGIGTAKFEGNAPLENGNGNGGSEGGIDTSVSFGGISSVSQKTDTSITLHWNTHADAVSYDIFDTQSGSSIFITSVINQAASSTSVTGLTPSSVIKFRVRLRTSRGLYDSNTNDLSVTMNSAPDSPTSLTLISPASSPGFSSTPTIQVGGVRNGDTVKLFTDNTCTTEVASDVATGVTIDLTTSALADGTHDFYATASNSVPNSSTCSTATVTYVKNSCPPSYVLVPKNTVLGTSNDFCIAKYEMKNVGGVATSQAASTPWVNLNATAAKTACTSLGANYDLISNPEWMTVASDTENTAANWSGNAVGTGVLHRGHSDNSPASTLAVTDTNDPYNGTGNNSGQAAGSGKEQRRSMTLSNGEVVWDLAGNVWEWVDWTAGGAFTTGPTTCTAGWTDFPSVSCGPLLSTDYMPLNPGSISPASYTYTYMIGQFFGGAGGAPLRGGDFGATISAGVFGLTLNFTTAFTYSSAGFRCVWRP